jgi:hypothetical protein
VTYRLALDHADLRPGDVIAVADLWVAGLRLRGRISAATGETVTSDAPVLLDASTTHTPRVTLTCPRLRIHGLLETWPVFWPDRLGPPCPERHRPRGAAGA